jgi:hypothetical protein
MHRNPFAPSKHNLMTPIAGASAFARSSPEMLSVVKPPRVYTSNPASSQNGALTAWGQFGGTHEGPHPYGHRQPRKEVLGASIQSPETEVAPLSPRSVHSDPLHLSLEQPLGSVRWSAKLREPEQRGVERPQGPFKVPMASDNGGEWGRQEMGLHASGEQEAQGADEEHAPPGPSSWSLNGLWDEGRRGGLDLEAPVPTQPYERTGYVARAYYAETHEAKGSLTSTRLAEEASEIRGEGQAERKLGGFEDAGQVLPSISADDQENVEGGSDRGSKEEAFRIQGSFLRLQNQLQQRIKELGVTTAFEALQPLREQSSVDQGSRFEPSHLELSANSSGDASRQLTSLETNNMVESLLGRDRVNDAQGAPNVSTLLSSRLDSGFLGQRQAYLQQQNVVIQPLATTSVGFALGMSDGFELGRYSKGDHERIDELMRSLKGEAAAQNVCFSWPLEPLGVELQRSSTQRDRDNRSRSSNQQLGDLEPLPPAWAFGGVMQPTPISPTVTQRMVGREDAENEPRERSFLKRGREGQSTSTAGSLHVSKGPSRVQVEEVSVSLGLLVGMDPISEIEPVTLRPWGKGRQTWYTNLETLRKLVPGTAEVSPKVKSRKA